MRLKVHTDNNRIEIKKQNENCLITGDGKTFPNDLGTFLSWDIPHDVMAIGRSINLYPGTVLHWANVDGPDSKWWANNLPPKNFGKLPVRHTLGACDGYDVDWDIAEEDPMNLDHAIWNGSTALFGVYISLAMGYQKIILAGCPLDSRGHWFFPEDVGPLWTRESYVAWFEFAMTEEVKKVKSMSGYTAVIVGKPTKEWCNGKEMESETKVSNAAL